MDKIKLAHDWAMRNYGQFSGMAELANFAWKYADAMQAEAEKREDKMRPDVLKEEWQPDWSQAPEWAKWWAMDMDKNCYWYEDKLHLGDVEWDRHSIGKSFKSKPYGYQGNWQDSLRKRPQ